MHPVVVGAGGLELEPVPRGGKDLSTWRRFRRDAGGMTKGC